MNQNEPCVYIVDDDDAIRDAMSMLLGSVNLAHKCFASADAFLAEFDGSQRGCLVLDIRMPGMNGLELQRVLGNRASSLPIIFISGHGDIPMAVKAMREGALDFMRKPFREQDLLDRVQQALAYETGQHEDFLSHQAILNSLDTLTPREREVFERVASGQANKVIGFDLDISERTVEVHRSQVMKKLKARTLAQLVRIKIASEKEAKQPI